MHKQIQNHPFLDQPSLFIIFDPKETKIFNPNETIFNQVNALNSNKAEPVTNHNVNSSIPVQTVTRNIQQTVVSKKAIKALPTPIRPNRLESWLKISSYDNAKTAELKKGFSYGFAINYEGPQKDTSSNNHASFYQNSEAAQLKINKEIEKGRIAGPFDRVPFDNFRISPLGIVPKKEAGAFRLIHDLSFPENDAINSFIPQKFTSVNYETLDDVVALVKKFGKGCLLAKADIEDAFRIVPIQPADYNLLGFKVNEKFYYDKALPMGCSTSCQTFEKLSCAVQWILLHHFKIAGMSHILDDFIFIGPPDSNLCDYGLQCFMTLAEDINIPVKHAKTVFPCNCCAVHGVEIDTVKFELRLPADKLEKINKMLSGMYKRRTVTLKELQSLLGLLSFACTAIVPGRAFLRRLYQLTCGVKKSYHHVTLNSEARADLAAWQVFLKNYNGRQLFLNEQWVNSDSIKLYTDAASSKGFAGIFRSKWVAGNWHKPFSSADITLLELYPIMVSLEIWGEMLSNHCVILFTDNAALVYVINNQTCKCKKVMKLVRQLVITCMKFNIAVKAKHIAGKNNVVADRLSRFEFQEARVHAPWLEPKMTYLPDHLHTRNWL